jgi:hypothetical protein
MLILIKTIILAVAVTTIFVPHAIASDTKTVKKLLNEWSKFSTKINKNQVSAIFITRVTSCSFCSLGGFNTLMSGLIKEMPQVNRISVITNADKKELIAYHDIFPKATEIVRAIERDIDRAFSLTVYPTFYLVSPDGTILFEQQDITHNLPPIDTLKYYLKKVKILQKSPSLEKTVLPKVASVKNIEEIHPFIQMTSISKTNESDNTAFILDGIQNSVFKIDLNQGVISRYYKLENSLEYWFDSDQLNRHTWPDGSVDTTNYFKMFQETSPLTIINSIHTLNEKLSMFCRLHTGYNRVFKENRKRIMFLVDYGLVSFSENRIPQTVTLLRNESYKIFPPIKVLSNGKFITRVFANTESDKANITIDNKPIFATYNVSDSSLKVSTNSKVLFNDDINEEDVNLYPDENQGFICVNRKLRWFFHANPLQSGDYDYKAIPPYGIWKKNEDKITSFDGYIHNNIFHAILLLENGELWLQKYSLSKDEVYEYKITTFRLSKYTQLKLIHNHEKSLTLLAKHPTKRWQLVRVSL